ncbi:MAG: hypothetical protein FJ399_10400, partial [Verrucomicrobia bacterium]|nr:hypothetical protein [Verrucomicrobiota bacterium]
MKFFTPAALFVAALVGATAALPFLPSARKSVDLYQLEVRLSAPTDANAQLFFDDGSGFREEFTARLALKAGTVPSAHLIPLPVGSYFALRLDPPEGGRSLVLHSLRIVPRDGGTPERIPLDGFKPVQQIQSAVLSRGRLEIASTPASDDPQLVCSFAPPLELRKKWRDFLRELPPYALAVFGAFAAILFLLDRTPAAGRARCKRAILALAARPARAVGVVAALAVIASAYPVVFLGQSFVSPNLGTSLLYDVFPTLPGYQSAQTTDVKLADVGAVMWQHVPFSTIQHRALLQGELPLWNRYNALGVPLLAQGQSMFGDPLHLLVVAANGAAWAWDLKYLFAKWLFAVGLGLSVLALLPRAGGGATLEPPAAGGSPPPAASASPAPAGSWCPSLVLPALLVAASAPFIGFFIYRVNHPAFFSLCYAPWPLYCLLRLALIPPPTSDSAARRTTALWATALVVANLAVMNSGTVKEAYMLLVCMNLSGLCVLLATATSWRDRLTRLGTLAWFGFLFVLLTIPIWATFLATLKNAYTGYNAASAYQIQPTLLLGLFDEIFYRPLMTKDQVYGPSLNFLLLLGFLYFLATLRLHLARRATLALAASSLLPLALAFGLVSPQWIVTLPFLGNIAHLDNTFSCALIVLWSVLAGVGFAAAARRLGTPDGRHDLIVAGLLLFALVFGWIAFRQAAHRPILGPIFSVHPPGQVLVVTPFIWSYLEALLLASVVLAVTLHCALARRTVTAAGGLLLAGCVAVLLWRHGLHTRTVGFDDFTCRPTTRVDFHARSAAMQFARSGHLREPGRGFGLHSNFFPGWTGVYGLEGIHGPDALVNPYVRELMGVGGVERVWDWRFYAEARDVASARPFFDALNVRYYFDLKSDQGVLGRSLHLRQGADLDVYESPTAWPRAFFTDRVDAYEQPAELVAKIRAAAGRPLAAAQNSDHSAQAALAGVARSPGSAAALPATNYRLTENSTTFTV